MVEASLVPVRGDIVLCRYSHRLTCIFVCRSFVITGNYAITFLLYIFAADLADTCYKMDLIISQGCVTFCHPYICIIYVLPADFVTPAFAFDVLPACFVTPAFAFDVLPACFVTPAFAFDVLLACFVTPALSFGVLPTHFVTSACCVTTWWQTVLNGSLGYLNYHFHQHPSNLSFLFPQCIICSGFPFASSNVAVHLLTFLLVLLVRVSQVSSLTAGTGDDSAADETVEVTITCPTCRKDVVVPPAGVTQFQVTDNWF